MVSSPQAAVDKGIDLSGLGWLTLEGSRVTDLDFDQYVGFATRIKRI